MLQLTTCCMQDADACLPQMPERKHRVQHNARLERYKYPDRRSQIRRAAKGHGRLLARTAVFYLCVPNLWLNACDIKKVPRLAGLTSSDITMDVSGRVRRCPLRVCGKGLAVVVPCLRSTHMQVLDL